MDEPIERRKLYELMAERLLAQIGSRRIKPGQTLPPERELAQIYRVGRSSVREALRMLESRGVIRSLGHGSFAVADHIRPLNGSLGLLLTLREADLMELFEVRKILEVEAAGLAASRRTDEHLAEMRAAVDEMHHGLEDGERYISADVRFHLSVARASGNRLTIHMMEAIRDLLQRALGSIYQIPGSARRSTDQHRAILEAIAAGHPGQARERMSEHLVRVEADIKEAGS